MRYYTLHMPIRMKSYIYILHFLNFIISISSQTKAEAAVLSFADTTANKKVVTAYLSALENFDHQKMKSFYHPSMTFSDKAMKGFRDFEKNTDTKWQYKILRADEDSVFAEEKEDNIFYDCLGVGERTQVYCYLLKDDLIFQTIQISMQHQYGEYKPAYARFLHWLQDSPAKQDSLLMKNNSLIFDSASAIRIKPWLMRWKELNKK